MNRPIYQRRLIRQEDCALSPFGSRRRRLAGRSWPIPPPTRLRGEPFARAVLGVVRTPENYCSGPRLYLLLYGFWAFFGSLVGNDPIILSGTAFLCYFTRVTGITDPTACVGFLPMLQDTANAASTRWIFSQFIAANASSAILVSSNPTNVLIAGVSPFLLSLRVKSNDFSASQAFGLNFLTGYTKFTLLPSLIAMLLAAPLTFYTFTLLKPPSRNFDTTHPVQPYIPAQLLPPDVDPRSALLDPAGAIFHTSLMAVTLVVLIGTSFVAGGKVEVWMVTAPAGILAFGRDIWSERKTSRPRPTRAPDASRTEEFELQEATSPPSLRTPSPPPSPRTTIPSLLRAITHRFPTTSSTISRLPLSLLLFAGGIFVLSRALTSLGWTSLFASWLATICTSPAITIFFLGYLITLVLCPLCGTNIGATIVVVQILLDPNFARAPHVLADPRILQGAIFSTALASNLGACSWTFSSSLAGLLWVSILKQKGVPVRAMDFAKWNCLFLPVLSTAASAVVLLECYYF